MSGFTLPITLPLTWEAPRASQFWAGQDRRIYARFYVSRPDGVTWQDMTGYLTSARISLGNIAEVGTGNSGVDAVVRQATFELMNDRPTVDSLHPLDRTSSWNLMGGVYAPLLWPNREVILDVAAVPIGVTPSDSDWVRMFHGYLGDSISGSSDSGRITLECRDLAKRLQDCYIETVREYGSEAGTPAEDVIQQIINDNITYSPPTLYCPVSPGFMIKPYSCEYKSVWDAIQEVAAQIGWFLGYKWIPDYNDFRLSFLAPPRGKDSSSADWDLTGIKIIVQHLDISDENVRNVFIGTYRDASTGKRGSVTVQDVTSVSVFGRRAMQIEEPDTSLIDTAEEMTTLLEKARHDLKDLTATTRLTLPLLPTFDVFDAALVTNPRLSSTQDFYAAETVEHVLDFDGKEFRTEVVGTGRVIGGHSRWLAMQTRPGSPGKPIPKTPRFTLIVAAKDSPYEERRNADYFCDGVADQEQINAALDGLPADGGQVVLLRGTFTISDSILVHSRAYLLGQGPATVIKLANGAGSDNMGMIMNYDSSAAGNDHIHLANFLLDGNAANNAPFLVSGIRLVTVSDSVVDGVWFRDIYDSGVYLAGCLRCTVSKGQFEGDIGVAVFANSSHYNAFSQLQVHSNVDYGLGLIDSNNNSVTNSVFSECSRAGIILSSSHRNLIEGNSLHINGEEGIDLAASNENSVTGNSCSGNGQKTNNTYANIDIGGDSNNVQANICRKGTLTNKSAYGIRIAPGTANLITNNDCYTGGSTAGISNAGTDTNFGAGNRNNDGTWSTIPN